MSESGASATKKSVVARSAPQNPYHPSPVHGSKGAVSEAYYRDLWCTPQAGMGKNVAGSTVLRNLWREEEEVLVRLSERSDLPFIGAREGGERLRQELKGTREMKQTDSSRRVQRSYSISTTPKTFQLPSDLSYTRSAWQKFRHRLGSFPQPAARRDEAWRG